MQTYYAESWINRVGCVDVLYSWSTLDRGGIIHVCLLNGLVVEIFGEAHPEATNYNELRVLHVHSSRFKKFIPMSSLLKELL